MCRRFRWFELLLRLTRPLRLLPPPPRSKIHGPPAPLRTVPKLRTRVGKAQGGGDGDGVPDGRVCDNMSCKGSKIIVYMCKFPPKILMVKSKGFKKALVESCQDLVV